MWYFYIIKLCIYPDSNPWSPSQIGQWVSKQCLCIIAISEPSMNHPLYIFLRGKFSLWQLCLMTNFSRAIITAMTWTSMTESVVKLPWEPDQENSPFYSSQETRRSCWRQKDKHVHIQLHQGGVLSRHQTTGACASASPGVWGVSMLATLRPNMAPLRKCYHEMFGYTFCLNQVENEICFTKTTCNDIWLV